MKAKNKLAEAVRNGGFTWVSSRNITRWISGDRLPRYDIAVILAKETGTDTGAWLNRGFVDTRKDAMRGYAKKTDTTLTDSVGRPQKVAAVGEI